MNLITQLNDEMMHWYESGVIDGTDLETVARSLDISKFTVYQYARGNGRSISTAEMVYREFLQIVNRRKELIEKSEILSDYNNN